MDPLERRRILHPSGQRAADSCDRQQLEEGLRVPRIAVHSCQDLHQRLRRDVVVPRQAGPVAKDHRVGRDSPRRQNRFDDLQTPRSRRSASLGADRHDQCFGVQVLAGFHQRAPNRAERWRTVREQTGRGVGFDGTIGPRPGDTTDGNAASDQRRPHRASQKPAGSPTARARAIG